MATLLSQTTSDVREYRRLRAWELHQAGWSQTTIAQALGVTPGAVSHWLKQAAQKGEAALRSRSIPGAPRKLSKEALARLPALLAEGAEAFGFVGSLWTCPRVVELIERTFGVRYTPQHVGALLHQIGWSRQKPRREARQRDPEAIQTFLHRTWPALKRGR